MDEISSRTNQLGWIDDKHMDKEALFLLDIVVRLLGKLFQQMSQPPPRYLNSLSRCGFFPDDAKESLETIKMAILDLNRVQFSFVIYL